MTITTVGLDADDTLWHNETIFRLTHDRFAEMLAERGDRDTIEARLAAVESRNLKLYGYGIKGFTLSMIETAIEVTDERVPAKVIREIIAAGQEMLDHPIELLPHAREVVEALSREYEVLLITKGDLLDQERKLAQSGLGEQFRAIEIVSHKTPEVYAQIFARHGEGAETALMAGNSMASDVVAPIGAGAWGVFVPHGLEWALERAPEPGDHPRYRRIATLGELPALIEAIERG